MDYASFFPGLGWKPKTPQTKTRGDLRVPAVTELVNRHKLNYDEFNDLYEVARAR